MKKGWTIGKADECDSGIALMSPDEQLKILVEYKGDSLAITAFVRCVSDDADILSVPHDAEPQWVQTVYIKVQDEFDLTKMRDWQLSETGTPYLTWMTGWVANFLAGLGHMLCGRSQDI